MNESVPEPKMISCPECQQWIDPLARDCPYCGCILYDEEAAEMGVWLTQERFLAIANWGCIVLYALSLLLQWPGLGGVGVMNILSPTTFSLVLLGATGAIPVFELGRWWTVLSGPWLHGSLLHIVFNLLWVRDLAPGVGQVYGASRLVVIYTVAAATGAILSSTAGLYLLNAPSIIHGAQLSVGASGAIFGLFGALVSYGQRTQNHPLRKKAFSYALVLFLFGAIMPNVDNWGHFGGFLGGYLITQLPGFNPHQTWGKWGEWGAIACLLATLASVIASVLDALSR